MNLLRFVESERLVVMLKAAAGGIVIVLMLPVVLPIEWAVLLYEKKVIMGDPTDTAGNGRFVIGAALLAFLAGLLVFKGMSVSSTTAALAVTASIGVGCLTAGMLRWVQIAEHKRRIDNERSLDEFSRTGNTPQRGEEANE